MEFNYSLIIIALLFTHFIADFICQTDWMAINKSKNFAALFAHVMVYMAAFQVGTALIYWSGLTNSANFVVFYAGLNGLFHLGTDYITSRINARLWADKKVHWFFVGVGADQFIHAVTLILTFVYLS